VGDNIPSSWFELRSKRLDVFSPAEHHFAITGILRAGNWFCIIVNVEAAQGGRKGVEMKQLDVLATVLVAVGAINWGLVGLAEIDLVAVLFGMRFGETSALTSVVYGLVGLAGVYQAVAFKGMPRRWQASLATR
jgi:uncharacterized membrane protein YuzA (DUF378 family)